MQTSCNILILIVTDFSFFLRVFDFVSGSSAWQRRPWQRLSWLHLQTRETSREKLHFSTAIEKKRSQTWKQWEQINVIFRVSMKKTCITVWPWLQQIRSNQYIQFDCCRTLSACLTAMNAGRTPMGRSQDGDSTCLKRAARTDWKWHR